VPIANLLELHVTRAAIEKLRRILARDPDLDPTLRPALAALEADIAAYIAAEAKR
jgi:hypothetical protein